MRKRILKASFDATGGKAIGTHSLAGKLPVGAIITNVLIDATTTFTSATDAATISVGAQTAGDLVAATAISGARNIWDAGRHGSLVGNFALDGNALTAVAMADADSAATVKVASTPKALSVAVAVEALTAGVFTIYVEYVY